MVDLVCPQCHHTWPVNALLATVPTRCPKVWLPNQPRVNARGDLGRPSLLVACFCRTQNKGALP